MQDEHITNQEAVKTVLSSLAGCLYITRIITKESLLELLDFMELSQEMESRIITNAFNAKQANFVTIDMQNLVGTVDFETIDVYWQELIDSDGEIPVVRHEHMYFVASDLVTLENEIAKGLQE
jgi:hypothetical protein